MGEVWYTEKYGYIMRIYDDEFVKSVYQGRIEGRVVMLGRPLVKWINRMS